MSDGIRILPFDEACRTVLDKEADLIVAMPTHFGIENPSRPLVIDQEQLRWHEVLRVEFEPCAVHRHVEDQALGQDLAPQIEDLTRSQMRADPRFRTGDLRPYTR